MSRTTYERLKAFCETNNISMSQLVETRVNDFLGADEVAPNAMPQVPSAPVRPLAPMAAMAPRAVAPAPIPTAAVARPIEPRSPAGAAPIGAAPTGTTAAAAPSASPGPAQPAPAAPMTSAAARFAVEPPLPIIKPRQDTAAPKPAEKRPEQIFTF